MTITRSRISGNPVQVLLIHIGRQTKSTNKEREKKNATDGFVCILFVFSGLSFLSCKAAYTVGGFLGFFLITSLMEKRSIITYYMQGRGNKEILTHSLCNKAVKKPLKRTEYGPLLLE